jgi:peptidyl-prolyl cis-trans isomerase SurA
MKKIFKILIFISCCVLSQYSFAFENKILIRIDQKIITTIDILNEINYLTSLNPTFKTADQNTKFEIAKNSLIKQALKEKEIYKIFKNIDLKDDDFKRILINQYSNKNLDNINSVEQYLKKFDLEFSDLFEKTEINAYWNEMIVQRFNKNININRDNIRENLLKNNIQKEFNLSEILFSISADEKLESRYNKIIDDINKNGFDATALKFSLSDTSSQGGLIGWVKESALNQTIMQILYEYQANMITKPIRIPSGFLILKINDIREINKYSNLDEEIEQIVKLQINNQLSQFSNILIEKIRKEVEIEYAN